MCFLPIDLLPDMCFPHYGKLCPLCSAWINGIFQGTSRSFEDRLFLYNLIQGMARLSNFSVADSLVGELRLMDPLRYGCSHYSPISFLPGWQAAFFTHYISSKSKAMSCSHFLALCVWYKSTWLWLDTQSLIFIYGKVPLYYSSSTHFGWKAGFDKHMLAFHVLSSSLYSAYF